MPNTKKLVGTLLAVCVVCGSVLALVNSLTKDEIAKQERLREERLRAEVLAAPGETITFDKPVTVEGRDYYVGRKSDGSVAGTVFAAETNKGYAGEIQLIVGVAADDKSLAGVRVLKHGETPGLGARINEIKPGDDAPWFMVQFKGLTADKLYVKQDSAAGAVDAITAATISSRAVTNAVRSALDNFTSSVAPVLKSGS